MKRINRIAVSFLLALGMVCSSYSDTIFTVYDYPPFDFNDEEFVAGKVDFTPVGTVSIWTQNEVPK